MNQEKFHLADIAGYQEEKEEAIKIIDILKNYETYKAQGASIPKGLLLCGCPGVGKTMFAKAIATEAGVPIYEFETSESENEDEAVKGLKELFAKAKQTIPSIIFIDELDELVSSTDRDGFYGFQSDYSRKTLKTLLTEIDGLSSSDGVLVIATTNSKRTIPDALIRSGRLEKQITFNIPTLEDRVAIAKLYLDKIQATHIDVNAVAKKTEGFTGADIKSLVNSSLMEAVRKKQKISLAIIVSVIPTIRYGEIKKGRKDGPSEFVCYHEIGHFLAQYGLTKQIGSISVEKYGPVAGSMEVEYDFADPFLKKKDDRSAEEILESICPLMGGIAGEEVFLGKRYCGSTADIQDALELIHLVMANGALGFELLPSFGFGKHFQHGFAEKTIPNSVGAEARNEKTLQILNEGLAKAKDFVEQYKELGELIFPLLREKEVLSSEELTIIVNDYRKEKSHEIHSEIH